MNEKVTVIAVKIRNRPPGSKFEVSERDAKVLCLAGLARRDDEVADDAPPTRGRRTYRRRDLVAEES